MPDEPSAPDAPKLECPKCGKPYERGGKFFERHKEKCDGKFNPAAKPRRAAAAPIQPSAIGNILKEARHERAGLQKDIEAIRAQQKILTEQMERLTSHALRIDQLIADLEKAKTD